MKNARAELIKIEYARQEKKVFQMPLNRGITVPSKNDDPKIF